MKPLVSILIILRLLSISICNTHIIRITLSNDEIAKFLQQCVELLGGIASIEKYKGTIRDSIYVKSTNRQIVYITVANAISLDCDCDAHQ